MDNSTRRELLNKARTTGYPGSILDAFTAYDQGRDLIGEFIQEQQQAAAQPPMQIAQTPEEQQQGLRPAHEAGQTDQSMAFPGVQPGQSFNTVGMKVPINIDKVDNQGNLVESYRAVPPGIQNLPTGPYEGTVIESPAKMQKGGFHQKIYTDPEKFAVANKAYNDSLTFYNNSAKRFPKDLYKYEKLKWFPIENEEIDLGTDSSGRQIVTTVQRPDPVSKQKILPTHYYSKKAQYTGSSVKTNKVTDKGGDIYEGEQLYEVYKKPTQEPVYQTRPEVKNLPYKDVTDALKNKDAGIVREYTTKELNPKYKKVYDKSPYSVKEYGPEGKFTHWAKEDEKIPGVWRPIKDTPSDLYVTKKVKFKAGGIKKYQTAGPETPPANLLWIGNKGQVLSEQEQKIKAERELDTKFGLGPRAGKVDKITPVVEEPEEFEVNEDPMLQIRDTRKTRLTTGKAIDPNKDLMTRAYPTTNLKSILSTAKARGLSKEDALTLAAMDLQETQWGITDEQTGHVINGDTSKPPVENFIDAFIKSRETADRLKIKDEYTRLQVYNGLGMITPDTEKNYHGFRMKKIYGVEVPESGINMRNNPLYGKQIVDLRDNVLRKNPEFLSLVDSYYDEKKTGGSYQTNQEISMYEWRTGRPEESRKRYIVGGLKNRVLYNKAKYKR